MKMYFHVVYGSGKKKYGGGGRNNPITFHPPSPSTFTTSKITNPI